MKTRRLLAAPLIVVSICLGMAETQAQPMIPRPEWLVPASRVIVVADLVEQHSMMSSSTPISDHETEEANFTVTAQIAKVNVSKVILGDPPEEPLIITLGTVSSEEEPGIGHGPMLLFLTPFDSRALIYKLVRALPIEKGQVPWVSDTSGVRMGPLPIDEVIAQLEQFIKLHPPKPTPTPESLPPPQPAQ